MARQFRPTTTLTVVLLQFCSLFVYIPTIYSVDEGYTATNVEGPSAQQPPTLPNVLVFIVDDLGWNQVGYHANKVGNDEIQTPNIDTAVADGIELNRGYVTPWCGPSRAAIMTGRTNVYNANVSQKISTFDDDIGFVAGLPIGTQTIAHAFKRYGASVGVNYTAHYIGKWGIGGTAWQNTPHGMGFDFFRGSWGTGIEACDGVIPSLSVIEPFRPIPFKRNIGPLLLSALPGYWEQHPDAVDSEQCSFFRSVANDVLSTEEKNVACKTYPRTPPKLIDLDLLDKFTEQIATHDFKNRGSLLHVYSTIMLHLPMAYPASYNEAAANNNYTNGMPRYFAGDQIKGPATVNDQRWATNKGVQFVDDIFGRIVQAYKDAGQWNNTIIYFTSDNGGVTYGGTANNNYPLRASKFSPFEGGIRVPQFISGGWINDQLQERRRKNSSTYIFANDIAPTLLEMAGGDVSFLYGNKTGAPFGSQLWSYIKDSLDPSIPTTNYQKVRKISYTPQMYFDVQSSGTFKFFYTGSNTVPVPRLYEPIWPKDGDLIMDSSYFSVNPCRPDNVPSDCCIMNIEQDWQENKPMRGNCQSMLQEAQRLFTIDGGCPKNSNGKNVNPICVESNEVSQGISENDVSLWTHYGAAGPFTNSKGQPLSDLPMKCVCYGLQSDATKKDFTYFIVRNFGPSQCGRPSWFYRLITSFVPFDFVKKPPQSISCDGSLALDVSPKQNIIADFEAEGFDIGELKRTLFLEAGKITALNLPTTVRMLQTYVNRVGRSDWPYLGKFPYLGSFLDSCKEKAVVPVPFSVLSITPYMFGTRDVTIPGNDQPLSPGLCIPFSALLYFCPSHQNAGLKPVIEWKFDGLNPYGTFADGTRWEPMGLVECMIKCPQRAHGTAYIGDGPHGVVV